MSIEYTIDIQLTELGFPDLAETRETTSGEAEGLPPTAEKTLPDSCPSSVLSSSRKRNTATANQRAVKAKDIDKQTANAEPQSSVTSTKTVSGGKEDEDSEDSDVSMVGDEEEDEYEEEAVDEEELDGMVFYIT